MIPLMTVNMHEAKTHFSKLIRRVLEGEEIVIARAGKPVARLVPVQRDAGDRAPGILKGLIHMSDDFDDPLPDDVLRDFM